MQNEIILTLNSIMASSDILTKIIPILADIFVFTYPLYLVYLYFFNHEISRWNRLWYKNSDRQHKYNALTILFSFIGSIIVNYIIKAFVQQPRPYKVLDLAINPKESLILNSIPFDSFPSDHAAVGMTIAISVLLLGYQTNNKKMITTGRIFLGFALIMDVARITMGIHRPIDIIIGSIIGALVAVMFKKIGRILICFILLMFLFYGVLYLIIGTHSSNSTISIILACILIIPNIKKINLRFNKTFYDLIVNFQEYIFGCIKK